MSTFTIVEFMGTKSVEFVSEFWLTPTKKHCFWPQTDAFNVKRMRRQHKLPSDLWPTFNIRVLEDNIASEKSAEMKTDKAMDTSNLSSDEEVLADNNKRIRRRTHHFATEGESDESEESMPLKAAKVASCGRSKTIEVNFSMPSSFPSSSQKSSLSESISASTVRGTPLQGNSDSIPVNRKFLEDIYNEVRSLRTDLLTRDRLILNELASVKQHSENISSSLAAVTVNKGIPLELPVRLPLESMEAFDDLCVWVNQANNSGKLVKQLALVGGNSAPEVTRRVMQRLFSDKLATSFTLAGRKEKRGLRQSPIFQLVLSAVRLAKSGATDKEVELSCNNYLKHLHDRLTRRSHSKTERR